MADSIILFPSKSHIADKAGTVITFNATNKVFNTQNKVSTTKKFQQTCVLT